MYEKETIIMIKFMGNLQAKLSLIYVYKQYITIGAGNFDSVGSHSSYVCIYLYILVFLYIHTTQHMRIIFMAALHKQYTYICICM